jgi:hypothetical protein
MEDFVTFELAKKLKEKGFDCSEPFAMYNELGVFHKLYSSADFIVGYSIKCRDYYDYEDFDDRDYVCPTISQVLKWLREEKKIHITILVITDFSTDADNNICEEWSFWSFYVTNLNDGSAIYDDCQRIDSIEHQSYEESAIAGIEYVLDNLI